MNIGQKALAFALGAFFVVGVATVATAATGAPDTGEGFELDTDEVEVFEIEIEADELNGSDEGVEFELSEPDEEDVVEIEVEETDVRVDMHDGDADYYHVPVGAVGDGEYDHDFDPSEASRDNDFAGADGYVVEADKVDTDDPRVVAHVAENDPEVDSITRADELKTTEVNPSVEASELEAGGEFEFDE